MILYQALFSYQSSDPLDLQFNENDIIEFLSQSSTAWYHGKNIFTGNTGLFPNNFVKIISLPSDIEIENIYVAINKNGSLNRGDILIKKQKVDDYILSCLLNDEEQNILKIPLSDLVKLKLSNEAPGFTKCVANRQHTALSEKEIDFSPGDTIWMERKINNDIGEGILHGKKGAFPLNKVYIEESNFDNHDRKNIWMTLFDYLGTDPNDLAIKKGEKLKFLDRIDNNWNLMQSTTGKIGMVPCSYVKNISIHSPLNKNKPPSSDNETNELTKDNPVVLRPKRMDNGVKIPQPCINNNVYENVSYYDEMDESLLELNLDSLAVLNLDNLDGNLQEEQQQQPVKVSVSTELIDNVPDSTIEQFNKREKRIENDIEVISTDIKCIQNKCSNENSSADDIQIMNCNLAFLKEEYKSKLKELEFVRDQKERFLAGELQGLDESDYDSIKLSNAMEKQSITREKVIEEILETERKFINDLKTTLEAFDKVAIPAKISDQDFNLLFGDLESVIFVAEEFLLKMSQNIESNMIDASVGLVFLQSLNSFEEVYKEYCVNYDRKLDLINKKMKIPSFAEFVSSGLNRLTNFGIITCALDMMLVKPLQRFLKYPLFLKTIIENTFQDHPDFTDLQAASSAFGILAQKINEKKRFEELRAMAFDRTEKWHMKTLHALQKKPKRVIVSISGAVQEDDNEYQLAVSNFKNLKKCILYFIDMVFILRDNLKEVLGLYSSIADSLTSILKSQFCSKLNFYLVTCKRDESDYFKKYICVLDNLVVNPLNKLLELFSGPILLIKKRQSKHIDYLGMKQRFEDIKVSRLQIEKMEQLKNQYSAINNTLKEELPILTFKATVILNECLANYLQLTTSRLQTSIVSLKNLIGEDQLSAEEDQRICRNQQNEILHYLQRELVSYNPQNRNSIFKGDFSSSFTGVNGMNPMNRNSVYQQTREDVIKLEEKFDPDNLARVKKDFVPTKPHQIYICAGTVVGILKRCNPQGHSSSWLVEVCQKRTGFVPRSYLALHPFGHGIDNTLYKAQLGDSRDGVRQSSISDTSYDLMQLSPNFNNNSKRISLIYTPPTTNRTNRSLSIASNAIRVALFNHQSRGESEISMHKDDNLEILENHDKGGGGDWSLVKNLRTGARGYVPTNYLSK